MKESNLQNSLATVCSPSDPQRKGSHNGPALHATQLYLLAVRQLVRGDVVVSQAVQYGALPLTHLCLLALLLEARLCGGHARFDRVRYPLREKDKE